MGNPGRSAYRFDISLLSSPAGVTNVFDESAKKLIRQARARRLANADTDKIASRFVAVFAQMSQDIYDNAKENIAKRPGAKTATIAMAKANYPIYKQSHKFISEIQQWKMQ